MELGGFLDLKGYGHLLWSGTLMTLAVGIAAMAVALGLGILGALAKLSSGRLLRRLATAYTVIIRGIPELVLLLLIYYGGTSLLQDLIAFTAGGDVRIDINAFAAGTLVVGFVYGAYATEIFRGAFLAVPKGQLEAGTSFGMSRARVFWRIRLPQAWRFALPGLANLWLTLFKATSITSVIGLSELARESYDIMAPTRMPFTTFFAAALIYLAITAVSDVARYFISKRVSVGIRQSGAV